MADSPNPRDTLLQLADQALLAACRVDVFRGTGRGGQKRNRTESAVRITHLASGIFAAADDTRSQHSNKRIALRRLRHAIALQWRCPPVEPLPPMPPRPAQTSPAYAPWVAHLLDILAAHGYRLAEAAEACGLSTSRLVRELARDPALWQTVNQERHSRTLPSLRMPR